MPLWRAVRVRLVQSWKRDSPFLCSENKMGTLLLVILILLLVGSAPAYPYWRNWGYRPSGVLTLLLIILLVLLFTNTVQWGWGPSYHPGP